VLCLLLRVFLAAAASVAFRGRAPGEIARAFPMLIFSMNVTRISVMSSNAAIRQIRIHRLISKCKPCPDHNSLSGLRDTVVFRISSSVNAIKRQRPRTSLPHLHGDS
jgi:hypothetical protein